MGTNKNSSSRTRTLLNCRLSRSSLPLSLFLFIPPLGVCKLAWTRSAWRMRRVATHNRNRGCHGGSRNTSFGGEGRTKGEKGRGERGDGDPWSNFEPSRSIYFSLAAEYQWSAASCIRHKRNRATKRRVIRYSCRCSSRRDRPRLNPVNTRSYRWRKISRFLMLDKIW